MANFALVEANLHHSLVEGEDILLQLPFGVEDAQRPAQQLLRTVAMHLPPGRVDELDVPVHVGHGDAVNGLLHCSFQPE